MYQNRRIGLIIPAAGSGRRMGTDITKTWINLMGKPVIQWTVEAFVNTEWVDQIVLVGKAEDQSAFEKLLAGVRSARLEQGLDYPHMSFTVGGSDRMESVYLGLVRLMGDIEYCMVHDGARPLISESVIERTLTDVMIHDSSVVCVPAKDTVKIATDDQFVDHTPDRSRVFAVQTPQTFERSLLIRAYERGRLEGVNATDDSSLVEALGVGVKLTLGSYSNIKITTPEDLVLAELLMKKDQ